MRTKRRWNRSAISTCCIWTKILDWGCGKNRAHVGDRPHQVRDLDRLTGRERQGAGLRDCQGNPRTESSDTAEELVYHGYEIPGWRIAVSRHRGACVMRGSVSRLRMKVDGWPCAAMPR